MIVRVRRRNRAVTARERSACDQRQCSPASDKSASRYCVTAAAYPSEIGKVERILPPCQCPSSRMRLLAARRVSACLHWLLIVCCCVPAARAQYVIDYWTTDKGLPQNSVLSIQQTPDGYLWFTTFDGLVRFDGVRFTVFNKGNSPGLTSNRFVRLFCEPDGTLWAATEDGGVVRYRQGNFQAWTAVNGLPSNIVMDIQRDIDGSVWIQTPSAVSHLSAQGRIETNSLRDWKSYKTYISPTGSRWEVDRTGLLLTRNGRSTRYPLPFDPRHPAPALGPLAMSDVRMVEGERGVLWLSAAGHLYRIDGGAVSVYTAADGMPQSFIREMMYDRDGNVWLATSEEGACRFSDRHFTCIKTANGLSSDFTTSIRQDREGAIWVGTNNRGLNRLTPGAVDPISTGTGFAGTKRIPNPGGSSWGCVGWNHERSGSNSRPARYPIFQAIRWSPFHWHREPVRRPCGTSLDWRKRLRPILRSRPIPRFHAVSATAWGRARLLVHSRGHPRRALVRHGFRIAALSGRQTPAFQRCRRTPLG